MSRFRVLKISDARPWREVILLALREIGNRSGGDYAPEQVFDFMVREQLPDEQFFGMWICLDDDFFWSGAAPEDAVCGFSTMSLAPDEINNPVAMISNGWVRRGYKAEPFEAFLPIAKEWAIERYCNRLRTQCERCSLGANPGRLTAKAFAAHLRGLAAYWRWISRRGFVMRETAFEMDLRTA